MSPGAFLLIALLIGACVFSFWRQLLTLLATLAVGFFCYGIYHVAQIMHL